MGIYQWKAQVYVRKTKMEYVVKNSRKSFYKTLLKISPFHMAILALKQVEVNTKCCIKN